MAKLTLTPALIRAAATDEGNRSMRKAGREAWSAADADAAADKLDALIASAYGPGDEGRFAFQCAERDALRARLYG